MTEQKSFSTSSNESREKIFSLSENEEEMVNNVKTYFKKKLNTEKKKRRKERAILQTKIKELQQQFDNTEREEMCKMYFRENDKCLHLEEEKRSRDLFVKEILKLLKNRTEELKLLKKESFQKFVTSHTKNEIKKMFFDDSTKTDSEKEDKIKKKMKTLNST